MPTTALFHHGTRYLASWTRVGISTQFRHTKWAQVTKFDQLALRELVDKASASFEGLYPTLSLGDLAPWSNSDSLRIGITSGGSYLVRLSCFLSMTDKAATKLGRSESSIPDSQLRANNILRAPYAIKPSLSTSEYQLGRDGLWSMER